jgi:peptidoglycan hydrolase CwlO-like protein
VSSPRRAAALVAGVLLLAGLPVAPARAETAAQAREAAQAASARVDAMTPRVERALRKYESALGDLATGVTRTISAEQAADEAAEVTAAVHAETDGRVRALYMTGGTAALYASVLSATGPSDAMRRVGYVQALVRVGAEQTAQHDEASGLLRERAGRLRDRLRVTTVTASQVERRYRAVAEMLAEASAELDALSERARGLAEAQALRDRIAALNAAVAASGAARVASARATTPSAAFQELYVAAARTCPGMSWTLLAAVGQVESGHGANASMSYAGAQGPMQFMPATFATYGVDGDGDGDREIGDPADAIFSAAHYLCANGAGRDEASLHRAVWHYNHAEWYVSLVLKLAGQYEARDS